MQDERLSRLQLSTSNLQPRTLLARYQVILAYDGTHFQGFQRQPAGKASRTVQGVVEAALRQLGWQERTILGGGRTDAGVHALGQVISFELEWNHPLKALQDALNALLPDDAAVQDVKLASPDFHPRYGASGRRYQYRIFCQPVRNPLRERYAWRVWPAVNVDQMQQAAEALIGTHDFAAFGTPPRAGGSTIRRVSRAYWQAEGLDWVFEIVANAFLYHMVRRLVFAQVAVGQGRLEPGDIHKRLNEDLAWKTPMQGLAPAHGLVLVEVLFPPEPVRANDAIDALGET